ILPMQVQINGETHSLDAPATVHDLLTRIGLDPAKVAVERNLEIVRRSAYRETGVADGDRLEIVHFIGGGAPDSAGPDADEDLLEVAGRKFRSRLIIGT